MASIINASTAGAGGVITTADASGVLQLQTAGATAVTVDASQNVTLAKVLPEASGGTGTSTGYYGFKNRIINGAMMIDQRNAGASVNNVAITNTFPVDRFAIYGDVAARVSGQRSTAAPAGFVNSVLLTSLAATTAGADDFYGFRHNIEGFNVADLGWGTVNAQPITLSFWVRSSLTGTFSVSFSNNAATRAYAANYVISVSNTWEQKTVTIAGDTSGTWTTDNTNGIGLWWDLGSGSNRAITGGSWTGTFGVKTSGSTNLIATNGATFYITGVQLEKGSNATSFDYRPYGTELSLCQRYYEKTYSQSVVPGTASASGYVFVGSPTAGLTTTTGYIVGSSRFVVTKRAAPTILLYDFAGTVNAVTAINVGVANTNGNSFYVGPISDLVFEGGRNGDTGTRTAAMAAAYHFTANAEL